MRFVKSVLLSLFVLVIGGLGYLLVAPPDMLRVGTNYSAKIVCSNVFIAGRDGDEVLAIDVQAPGHPLLKYISVDVDEADQTVTAQLFGFLAPALAQYRDGLGCTNLHGGVLSDTELAPPTALSDDLWPMGNSVAPSQNPELEAVLSESALVGEGHRATVVVKDGRIIGESYAKGFGPDTPLLGWSMAKTVTAALIGTMLENGKLIRDDDLTASYSGWAEDDRRDITVGNMLGMVSGLTWNEGYGNVSDVTQMLYLVDDMAGFAAGKSAETAPETVFNYSSGTSTMLSRLWQDAVGKDNLAYPRDALFGPLGMTSAVLETDAKDTFVGSSYLYATARDWARFGQLLLQEGVWDGVRLLPDGFTGWMTEPVAASGGQYGRGHIWREPPGASARYEDSVWLSGHDGQSIGIFPSHDMVIVRMGLTPSSLEYSPVPLARAVIAATAG